MASAAFKLADLAVPGLGMAGQIGGAVLGGKGAKQQAQIQAKSAADALAFQREQAAREEARYNQQVANYQQQVAQYNAGRNALLSRYGIDIGDFSPPTAAPSGAGVAPPSVMAQPTGIAPPATGETLGEMIAGRRPGPWNDWATYGLQRRV